MVKLKKRLFVGLLSAAFSLIVMVTFALWYLTGSGYRISEDILLIVGIVLGMAGFVLALGLMMTLLILITRKGLGIFNGLVNFVLTSFFPLALGLGRLLGIDKDKIRGSFIEVHNQLIHAEEKKEILPEELLLLIPHCLQWAGCPHKITLNPDNCRRCGRCIVSRILDLRDEYGVKVGIASGGSQARRLVKELRPRAIVAIACERDLTSGIQDVSGLPVLGVVNKRPEGPCINTTADIEMIRKAIDFFLNAR